MHYIGIQGSYNRIEIAYCENETLKAVTAFQGTKASSHLIPLLEQFFQENQLTLKDLTFIAADKGPGAFTSLRVTIATLNGIGYATHIPLVGVNGLYALYQEACDKVAQLQRPVDGIICLLNAYSNDVYFLIKDNSFEQEGCGQSEVVLDAIGQRFAGKRLLFVGNGVPLHVDAIATMSNRFAIQYETAEGELPLCSAAYVAKLGLQAWQDNPSSSYVIVPHYLKEQTFAIRKAH